MLIKMQRQCHGRTVAQGCPALSTHETGREILGYFQQDYVNFVRSGAIYPPGVATVCEVIVADPGEARNLSVCANLVAVITNGTVFGLGASGLWRPNR